MLWIHTFLAVFIPLIDQILNDWTIIFASIKVNQPIVLLFCLSTNCLFIFIAEELQADAAAKADKADGDDDSAEESDSDEEDEVITTDIS